MALPMQPNNDCEDQKCYRAEIPNIIDDFGLSVYAYRLYGHYKRSCGPGGDCEQGVRYLSSICGFSTGKVTGAKKELVEAGLLWLDTENKNADKVSLPELWSWNFRIYHLPKGEQRDALVAEMKRSLYEHSNARSSREHLRSRSEHLRSSREQRKEPIRKEPIRNNSSDKPVGPVGGRPSIKPDLPFLQIPYKWLVSSIEGTKAHVGHSENGRPLCKSPLTHRENINNPIGSRESCPECWQLYQKEIAPKPPASPRPVQAHMLPIQTWCNELEGLVPKAFDIGKFSRVSQEWQRKGVTADQMSGAALLFNAWAQAHPGQPVISWQVAQMRGVIDSALDLHSKGYSPGEVAAFVKLKKKDDFWKGQVVPFAYVATNLPTWKAESKTVSTGPDLVDDPDRPGGKITRQQLANRIRERAEIEAARKAREARGEA